MKYFSVSILSKDELYTSSDRMQQILSNNAIKDPFVGSVLPVLQKNIKDLGIALGKDSSSEFTDELANKDENRDTTFVGLRDYCKAFTNSSDKTKAKAAELLINIFQERGWSIFRLGYSAESSQLNVLIQDLEGEAAQNALAAINATDWLTDLKAAQQAFENTYQEKVSSEAGQDYPLISETRKRIARYMQALLSYIDIQSELNSTGFTELVEKIDEVITDTLSIARARRTRNENENEEVLDTEIG